MLNCKAYTRPVKIASYKTYHVSITKPKTLMLFRATVAVYYENHMEHTNTLTGWVWVWVLCYDRRSVGQSVLEQSTHLGLTTRYLLVLDNYGPVFVGVLSEERTGLSFVYAAGPRQRSLSWVRVPLDHILLSHTGDFPFRRLLRLAGSRWRYWTPPPHRALFSWVWVWVLCHDRQPVGQSVLTKRPLWREDGSVMC
jgi:hypothetical protein